MPKRQQKETDSTPKVSRFQKFETVTIPRGEIKNAPYNPRTIDVHARKKLKEQLKKRGLIETLCWNRRTGNLVGGHQRISILDDLEGSQDYLLTVSAIDVDEKTEKELNIFLNNASAQGSYDLDALGELLKDGISIEETGFDTIDLQIMFDGSQGFEIPEIPAGKEDKAQSDIEKIAGMKQRKKDWKEKAKQKDDAEYYVIAVFRNRQETDAFLKGAGFPIEDRYISGERLATLLGIELRTGSVSPGQGKER